MGRKVRWTTTVHSVGAYVDAALRASIEERLRQALDAFGGRIGHVHVRVYGRASETGLYTCNVRVDVLPSGGIALGEHAMDPCTAVARAAARVGPAVRRGIERGIWPGTRAVMGRHLLSRASGSVVDASVREASGDPMRTR